VAISFVPMRGHILICDFEYAQLGRGLINAQPQAYGCKLDECKIVRREFVVAGRYTATVLDLIEEPLDQVASPVKIRTEA
jgi:hypothetical protein